MHIRPEDRLTVAVFLSGLATMAMATVLYLIDNLLDRQET